MIDTNGAAPAAAPDAPPAPTPAVVAAWNPASLPRLVEPVTIQLDRVRPLRLTFRALRTFEQETGLSAFAREVWGDEPKLPAILAMLWAALLEGDPGLTLAEVEELPGLELAQVRYINECLRKCWGQDQPPPDPDALPNRRPPTNG